MGQSDLLPAALLNALEGLPTKIIDLSVLFSTTTAHTPEESLVQVFREARRVVPSVVYMPRMTSWWNVVGDSVQATCVSLIEALPVDLPVLILATVDCTPGRITSQYTLHHALCHFCV